MKVSVLMITYNQERYIAQALDSVLMQEVDFAYEIVIGEDCSTDGTRDIVLSYQRRHPDKIRLLLPDENLGMIRNFAQTYYACLGQYVAILEGDDFWTCADKLQKQVSFLDANPECSICFTTTKVFFEENDAPGYMSPSDCKALSTIDDLLLGNFMQTCSVMFRNKLFGELPDWFFSGVIGDYPLHVLNAAHGHIGYLNDVMAAYRIHSSGVWSMQMDKNFVRNVLAGIQMYRNLDEYFAYKYHSTIKKVLHRHEFALCKWHLAHKNYKAFTRDFFQATKNSPRLVVSELVKMLFGLDHLKA
jgi:glycosyltransferase involved in cell wall biosynthesis